MITNERDYVALAAANTRDQQAVIKLQSCLEDPKLCEREKLWVEEEMTGNQEAIANRLREMATWDAEHNADRKGTWIPLYSGYRIWLEDPRPQDIRIEDIAHALANLCRYGGQAKKFYSVAQHSVIGSWLISEPYKKAFLVHDATETYLSDVITPLKRILGDVYKSLEARMMQVVYQHFNLPLDEQTHKAVKHIDDVMLCTEIRDVTTTGYLRTVDRLARVPGDMRIEEFWLPDRAEMEFKKRYHQLFED